MRFKQFLFVVIIFSHLTHYCLTGIMPNRVMKILNFLEDMYVNIMNSTTYSNTTMNSTTNNNNTSMNNTMNMPKNMSMNMPMDDSTIMSMNMTMNMPMNTIINMPMDMTMNMSMNMTKNMSMNSTMNMTMNMPMNMPMNMSMNIPMNQPMNNLSSNMNGMNMNMSMEGNKTHGGSMEIESTSPMPMPMVFYASSDNYFVFKTWHTQEGQNGLFFLGCFLTFLFSFFGALTYFMFWKFFQKEELKKLYKIFEKKPFLFTILKILSTFVFYFFGIIQMLLIMSFNVFVVFAIALGYLTSYIFFNIQMEVDDDESSEKARCGCEC